MKNKNKGHLQASLGFAPFALVEKEVPTRILILKAGDIGWEDLSGFNLTADQANEVIAEFKRHGTQIPIDYEHTSALEPGEKGIKAIAAGWITALSWVEGQGLFATVEWTEQAKQEILSGQYKYYSPVIISDKKTHAIERLHSVALTNKPRTRNQRELLAASVTLTLGNSEAGVETMDLKKLRAALLAAGVKLADDADDAAVIAASETYLTEAAKKTVEPPSLSPLAAKLGLAKDATVEVIAAKLDEFQKASVPASDFKAQADRLAALEAKETERACVAMIGKAVEDGKLNPNNDAQMTWARAYSRSDAKGFESWAASAEKVVPTGRVVNPSAALDKGGDGRAAVIVAAKAEYAANRDKLTGVEPWAFVEQELHTKGLAGLNAAEKKALIV